MDWDVMIQAILVAESLRKSEWCSGNEFAAIQTAVERWIENIPCSVAAPLAVKRAIVLKFLASRHAIYDQLGHLSYDELNDCYMFLHAGMTHGVEPDGYIHT